MKIKYLGLLAGCMLSLSVVAQPAHRVTPFPATCLSVDNELSPNDAGEILFLPIQDCPIQGYHLVIFDRAGELVFETNDENEGWKADKGEANGVYFWKVTGELPTAQTTLESTGEVTLTR